MGGDQRKGKVRQSDAGQNDDADTARNRKTGHPQQNIPHAPPAIKPTALSQTMDWRDAHCPQHFVSQTSNTAIIFPQCQIRVSC